MARVRPFAAWRYAGRGRDVTSVTAPPYDVISPEQRATLLEGDPHNVVALELPDGPWDPGLADGRYANGRRTWDAWREEGVLAHDREPAVYVLEQTYDSGGSSITRHAFIAEVGLEPFDAGIVLPHERTLPKALGDRFELIKATGANLSQVLGLFEDPAQASAALIAEVVSGDPVAEAVDADGVVSRLWVGTDPNVAERLAALMESSRIFIADGHHRYTTALAYRDLRRAESPGAPADAPFEFVMMALVNMDDPDLVVLPTHRVADAAGTFDPQAFESALAETFVIEDLPPGHPSGALDALDVPGFLFKTRADARPRLARLRDDVALAQLMPGPQSDAWKCLDVSVLQELVLDPILDIHPDRPATLERLTFVKDAHRALEAAGEHDVAFVLRPTRMEQLRAVALAGETMPQKSTYFYPKLLSGLVLRSAE